MKILAVAECSFVVERVSYTGFSIQTCAGYIDIGIQKGQQCCESYGYLTSLDNFNDFIGAQVLSVRVVDKAFNLTDLQSKDICADYCIFVNIETTKGLFQITVYNEHNGYYGHNVYVSNCGSIVVDRCL